MYDDTTVTILLSQLVSKVLEAYQMSEVSESQAVLGVDGKAPKKQANQDVAALFTNLKLQHAHYQPFTRRQGAKTGLQITEVVAREPVARIRTQLGIFSPAGGSGKSLLAAGIASLLCQLGKRVLLVDASPWQSLAFHFGATETRAGRRTFFAPGLPKSSVHLLSCGENQSTFPDLKDFDVEIPVDCVVFDLSGVSGELLLTYLRECDHVLVPLLPDPLAVRMSAGVLSILELLGASAPHVRFILNNMDESAVAREVHESLMRVLGKQLFPSVILNQLEVRKALEDGIVLPFYAPKAQASLVLGEIARSLLAPEKAQALAHSRWTEG